jgi:uncharacterized SAM-binding protein YcdF (DUF218 family)
MSESKTEGEGWQGLRGELLRGLAVGPFVAMGLISMLALFSNSASVWLSAQLAPLWLWQALVATFAALVAMSFGRGWTKQALVAMAVIALAAALDSWTYYQLLREGLIRTRFPLPFSAIMVIWLSVMIFVEWRASGALFPRSRGVVARGLGLAARGCSGGAALLALILCFGATDYRRPADCAIVLGAGVRPGDRLSQALGDRVNTAIDIYLDGQVKAIIMTGGSEGESYNEARAMAAAAMRRGVPKDALILDPLGFNTAASARNSARIMAERNFTSALVVSHAYHLARCKLAFRSQGLRVYTVPARRERWLRREPWFLLREIGAYLYYSLPLSTVRLEEDEAR